jgi:tight adherence protein C
MKAGLDFNRALAQVVAKRAVSGALAEELKVLTSEIDLGTTRREAFQNLLQRAPSEPLRGVVAAIIQADQMGTPMSDVLAVQSSVMKIKRTQTAEKMAAEAPIKMLVPIMIVLLVVLLTIFGGLVVKGMTGGLLN